MKNCAAADCAVRRTPSSSSIASFGRPRRVTVALHSDCIEIGEPFSEYPRSFCPAIRGVSCTRGVNATAAPDEAAGVIRPRAPGVPAARPRVGRRAESHCSDRENSDWS